MKKGIRTVLLIGGSVLLLAGGGLFVAGCNSSKLEQVVRTFDLTDKNVQNLNFDLSTSDLEFIPTTDGTRKVMLYENEKIYHEEKVEENTLYVVSKGNEKWYEQIKPDLTKKKVEVYLPSGELGTLKVSNATGDIKIPREFSFESSEISLSTGKVVYNASVKNAVSIRSSTGDVSLSDVHAKSMKIKRSTGKAVLNNVSVDEVLELEGSTGKVETQKLRGKTLLVSGSTGDVELNEVLMTEDIKIKVSTGEVEFSDMDASGIIDIETSTGDIKGSLLSGKTFDVRSDTGKIDIPEQTIGGQLCKVRTDTGNIKISVKA